MCIPSKSRYRRLKELFIILRVIPAVCTHPFQGHESGVVIFGRYVKRRNIGMKEE